MSSPKLVRRVRRRRQRQRETSPSSERTLSPSFYELASLFRQRTERSISPETDATSVFPQPPGNQEDTPPTMATQSPPLVFGQHILDPPTDSDVETIPVPDNEVGSPIMIARNPFRQRVIAPEAVPEDRLPHYVTICEHCGSRLCVECAYVIASAPGAGCYFSNVYRLPPLVHRLAYTHPEYFSEPEPCMDPVSKGSLNKIIHNGLPNDDHLRRVQPFIGAQDELALRTVINHVTLTTRSTIYDDIFVSSALVIIERAARVRSVEFVVINADILNGEIQQRYDNFFHIRAANWVGQVYPRQPYPFGAPDDTVRPTPVLHALFNENNVNHYNVCRLFHRRGLMFSQLFSPRVEGQVCFLSCLLTCV